MGQVIQEDRYLYEPLISEDAVRILSLEPAEDFQSPLRCSITQHRRNSESHSPDGCNYSAVSYRWGNPELSHKLLVSLDTQLWACLRITKNVDSLLRHFRVPYKVRLLWIDAICLNQEDEMEKTQQIPLMGRIYHDAKQVHIWLGEDEVEKARRAFAIIRHAERENQGNFSKDETRCLADFFNRAWFTRRWIIQEAVFSHDAVFHCKFHTLGLSRVMAALRQTKTDRRNILMARGSRMLLSSDGLGRTSQKSLLSLLWDLHDSDCSDHRDRIAAVYGLAINSGWPLRQYDPGHWTKMYMDLASHYINTTASGSHEILCHLCQFGSIKSRTGNVPSWVPDWSTRRQQFLPNQAVKTRLDLCSDGYRQMHMQWREQIKARAESFFDSPPLILGAGRREAYEWLTSRNFFSIKLGVSGRRLRVGCHPMAFFDRGGIIDRVLCPSKSPHFWEEVIAALDLPHENSLLTLIAQIDADDYTSWLTKYRRIEKLREGLHTLRDQPDAMNEHLKAILERFRSSLCNLAIVRIEAMQASYWAIGPPNSLVGDWMVPLMLPEPDRYVPMMCLRPMSLAETEPMRHHPSGAGVEKRCLRFFSHGSATEVGALHVTAKFVGPASHCDATRLVHFYSTDLEKAAVLDIIRRANAAARSKGLPGPIVFDIV